MSGIPVGSPPVPPGRHAAPSGWYADPLDATLERYWDGWQWSRNTRDREGGAVGQPPQTGYPSQPGYTPARQNGPGPPGPYPGYPAQGPGPQGQGPSGSGPRGFGPQGAGTQVGRPGQAAYTADGVRLSGWWWRVLAGLVDSLIIGVLASLASLPVLLPLASRVSAYFAEVIAAAQRGETQPPVTPTDLIPYGDQLLIAAISVALTFAYHLAFVRWRSATPGKLLCGLRVVPVDEGHAPGPLGWRPAVVRALVWAAPGLNGVLGIFQLLDLLFPLWQPKRQAIHDLVARTQVTRRG